MKGTAQFIQVLAGFRGDARLYKVCPPIEYNKPYDEDDPPAETTEYVVVSAVNAIFSGAETYIFPSDEDGHILNLSELDGSYRGGYNHTQALNDAGYEVV